MAKDKDKVIELPDGRAEYKGYIYTRKRSAYQRAAKDRGTHTSEEWEELCKKYDYKCCNCESEVIGGYPTKDHIIPIKHGGSDKISNLQPLCRQCNLSKGNLIIDYR